MALPRRVPWTSSSEFEQVFELLFGSDGSPAAQQDGIHRIQVWQSRGCCPYAGEATAALMAVILQDAASPASTGFHNQIRLAYAMALIRFVNGLVDPAQQGPFARSIAGIAQQIGLPLWFVELRHAATHEDLPTLGVLRDAGRKAMDCLYHRYWVPQTQTVEPEYDADREEKLLQAKEELRAVLNQYKTIQKQVLRDTSLFAAHDKELQRLERLVERWVVDAGTDVFGASADASGSGGPAGDSQAVQAGCQALANVLVGVGCLVPSSKGKRSSSKEHRLPDELLGIWGSLLDQLDDTFESFTSILIWQILDALGNTNKPGSSGALEKSYLATLTAWAIQILVDQDEGLIDEALRFCLLHNTVYTATILTAATKSHPHLAGPIARLQQLKRNEPALVAALGDEEVESALSAMEHRCLQLQDQIAEHRPAPSTGGNLSHAVGSSPSGAVSLAQAWSILRLSEHGGPRPFGYCRDEIPQLSLHIPATAPSTGA